MGHVEVTPVFLCVVVQPLSHVSLGPPWFAAHQASLSFSISWNLFKLMSFESVMLSNHHILCLPLLLLPSNFPSFRVFSNESALHTWWPKFGASASVLQMISSIKSFRIDFLIEESIIYMRDPSHLRRKMSLGKTKLGKADFFGFGKTHLGSSKINLKWTHVVF